MPKIHQRVVNPHSKVSTKSAAARGSRRSRRSRQNPLGGGELILATMGNPHHHRKNARRNPHHGRRSNPSLHHIRKARRNPRGIGHFTMGEVGKVSLGAAAGSLAAPALTQMVLGSKNTGAMGYLGNIAVSLALGFGAAQFVEPTWALGIAAGGVGSTILRIWSENVSKTSPSALAGLGDLNFSNDGMGAFVDTPYPLPTVSRRSGQYQVVQDPFPRPALPAPVNPAAAQVSPAAAARAAAAAPAPAAPAAALASGNPRFASRFAA